MEPSKTSVVIRENSSTTLRKKMRIAVPCVLASLFLLYLLIASFYTIDHPHPGLLRKINNQNNLNKSDEDRIWERISIVKGTKNILLWKNSWGYRFGIGRATFVNSGCRVTN